MRSNMGKILGCRYLFVVAISISDNTDILDCTAASKGSIVPLFLPV